MKVSVTLRVPPTPVPFSVEEMVKSTVCITSPGNSQTPNWMLATSVVSTGRENVSLTDVARVDRPGIGCAVDGTVVIALSKGRNRSQRQAENCERSNAQFHDGLHLDHCL